MPRDIKIWVKQHTRLIRFSAWEGKRERFLLPSFYVALCIASVHRKRNSSLSSLCSCPLSAEKNHGGHWGTEWDHFLWYWVLPVPKEHSSSACKLRDRPACCGGHSSEISSERRQASARRRRKAPQQGSACPGLRREQESLWALRETIRTGSCSSPRLGSPRKRYNGKNKITSPPPPLSWSYFFAVLQL